MTDGLPDKGDRVRIDKGTKVYSTLPRWDGPRPAGRTYTVSVNHSIPARGHGDEEVPAKVYWRGSCGYYKWCALHDVEVVGGR